MTPSRSAPIAAALAGELMPTEIIEAAVGLMGLGAVWGVYRLITLAARSRERLRF